MTRRFAFVCDTIPPSTRSGQSAIIYRLLSDLDPSTYCLISEEDYSGAPYSDREAPTRLTGVYRHVPQRFGARAAREHPPSGLRRWVARLRQVMGMLWRARAIAGIIRREGCDAVLAATEPLTDLPTGYLASRLARVPFYAYLFDDYSTKWAGATARLFARVVEPLLLRSAAGVIVPNEFLAEELERRHGLEAAVIRNACDLALYEMEDSDVPDYEGELRIVYTGVVYDAHFGALRNVLAMTPLLGGRSALLHLYTPTPVEFLVEHGLGDPVVYHGPVPLHAMPRIQRAAHILVLPLSFDSPYPQVIRTSAPAKMGEYLASRRPILVHAPADSFVSMYFRRHQCGLVVDEDDPNELARAVEQVVGDEQLRERLAANAWERARADFDLSQARAAFSRLLELDAIPQGGDR